MILLLWRELHHQGCHQGFIQVFWEGTFFAKIVKETGHLGMKIAGVSCKIWEFCMILKKLQLGMGPVFGPCETRDKALATYHPPKNSLTFP